MKKLTLNNKLQEFPGKGFTVPNRKLKNAGVCFSKSFAIGEGFSQAENSPGGAECW